MAPCSRSSLWYLRQASNFSSGPGLAEAGVELGALGEVVVDAASANSVPSIHAVGDVTNRISLAPVAIREDHAFADSVFGGQP